jgi:hypothetical protein
MNLATSVRQTIYKEKRAADAMLSTAFATLPRRDVSSYHASYRPKR